VTVEFYIQNPPQYTHEREALVVLAKAMQRAFGGSNQFYLLAANVQLWRAQADALVLAPHAIALIELKACADPVYGRVRGSWRTVPGSETIRGGSYENPYQQIINERKTLIKYLDHNRRRFLAGDQAREMDGRWGHVSAAIVFVPHLHPNSDIVMPPESRAWLKVIGLNEAPEFLYARFSPNLDLRPQELRLAVQALHCQPWTEIESLLSPMTAHGHLWLLDEAGQRTYAFPILGEATLGRSRENTLVVPPRFSRTSRHHAFIRLAEDAVRLYDQASTHGTFVNGQAVSEQGQELCDGDLVILGDLNRPDACRLRFERWARPEPRTASTSLTAS